MWDIDIELSYRQQQFAVFRQQAAEYRLLRQAKAQRRWGLWSKGLQCLSVCLLRCGRALERRVQLANSRA